MSKESKLYALIDALDKGPATEKQNTFEHPFYQPKKCDHQCIDCFMLFCQQLKPRKKTLKT